MDYNFKLFESIKRRYGTQDAFAREVDIRRPVVSMVLNGRYNLTGDEKRKWAEVLGVSVEDLWPEAVGVES